MREAPSWVVTAEKREGIYCLAPDGQLQVPEVKTVRKEELPDLTNHQQLQRLPHEVMR